MKTLPKLPTWAESWKYWGYAIGSDDRYKPRWYERRAYHMGLRDASRIIDRERWDVSCADTPRKFARTLIQCLHRYAFRVLGSNVSSEQFPPGM